MKQNSERREKTGWALETKGLMGSSQGRHHTAWGNMRHVCYFFRDQVPNVGISTKHSTFLLSLTPREMCLFIHTTDGADVPNFPLSWGERIVTTYKED